MPKVSVVIPSRNERFLQQTVDSLLDNAWGEIEVFAVLDGPSSYPPLRERPNLTIVQFEKPCGLRPAINAVADVATGTYLMKTDSHCLFAPGFDLALSADCDGDWVVIPRRYRLDSDTWSRLEGRKAPYDLHYLCCPLTSSDGYGMHGVIWPERDRERREILIDDTMSFQGSCWFMTMRYFKEFIGPLDVIYGTWSQEPQEIGLKTWLGGGRVVSNKKTWYAHLHKGARYGRGYLLSKTEVIRGHELSARYWMGNKWSQRIHDMAWLIDEKFPNTPTWPKDWKERNESFLNATSA